MLDKYDRNINYLRLSITDNCNYRCIYCMAEDNIGTHINREILSIEELIEIGKVAVACGINKIRLTGGEPLIRDGILDLCEGLKSINGLKELAITTNGAKLFEIAKDLKQVGVDRLNISLDTLDKDKFNRITRCGKLDDVLRGLEESVKAGFTNTKINVVLMAGINDDEIEDFVKYTRYNQISVRFIELMPIGPSKDLYDKHFISNNEVIRKVPELIPVSREGVSNVYKYKDGIGTIGLISPISNCFCKECNRLRVTADGKLLPCLHSDLKINVRGLSYEEKKAVFQLAINKKPERHHIIERRESDSIDYMHQIGG